MHRYLSYGIALCTIVIIIVATLILDRRLYTVHYMP